MVNKIGRYLRSLRFFIIIIVLVVGLVPAYMVSRILVKRYYDVQVTDKQVTMQNECVSLCNQLLADNYLASATQNLTVQMETIADMYDGRLQLVNQNYKIVLDTYRIYEDKFCVSKEVVDCFAGHIYTNTNYEDHYIEYVYPITDTTSQTVIGAIVLSASTTKLANQLTDMQNRMYVIMLMLSVFLVVCGYLISKLVERPFARLINQLELINEGNMNLEIVNKGYTEIIDINNGYSGAMKQLKDIDQSRQEFVSNVSHELKTPITSIKVLVDTLLLQEGASEELYKEFLTDVANEVNRENDIINDLLSLVRLDKGVTELNISLVNINEFLEGILRRVKPIATGRNIELTFETFRTVMAEIDEVKLSLAIMNVVENGIKYNKDNGQVTVSLNADHRYFYVAITDTGVGIPEDEAEKIFERFYRVDKARSRETGGTGLGLAITKRVIVMHKGTITVSSVLGEGTTFTIRVPLNYVR